MKNNAIKNITMVLSSNFGLMGLGLIISFALPLIVTIEDYALWQLYLYYSGFVGFFVFGFNDGLNLRYAGKRIDELNGSLFKLFFRIVIFSSIIISIIAMGVSFFLPENSIVFIFASLNIAIFNINGFCMHTNQMTSRFKEYSIANIVERLFFVASIPILMLLNQDSYIIFISLNIVCRLIAMFYNIQSIQPLFVYHEGQFPKTYNLKSEVIANFKGGFPLMIASICSMFMTTIPRVVVEQTFQLEDYALFSFGYTTISLVIQIVVAMSAVLYPTIKKLDYQKQKGIYITIKNIILLFCVASLLVYYVIYLIVKLVYVDYVGVLNYLYALFPILIYQSFNSLVVANYSRVLRLEIPYMLINLAFLIINYLASSYLAITTSSIPVMLFGSLTIMHLWIYFSDKYIFRKMNMRKGENTINIINVVGLFVFSFVFLNANFDLLTAITVYALMIIAIIVYYKNDLRKLILKL